MSSKKGAEMPWRNRIVSMPRRITKTFRSQKSTKQTAVPVELGPGGSEGDDHGVDGFAADPGLNAKPATSDEGAENRGDVGTENAKRSARIDGEGDAVLRAGVSVEKHGNQHEHVAEKNGKKRLAPVHAAGDHAAGQHVGGDVHAHGDPKGGVVVGAPAAALGGDWGEVLIVEGAGFDGGGVKTVGLRFGHN